MRAVEADDLPELHSFSTGLRRDFDAARVGLTVRGQVKVKVSAEGRSLVSAGGHLTVPAVWFEACGPPAPQALTEIVAHACVSPTEALAATGSRRLTLARVAAATRHPASLAVAESAASHQKGRTDTERLGRSSSIPAQLRGRDGGLRSR